MRRLKTILLNHPQVDVNVDWGEDLKTALTHKHDVHIFDRDQPAAPQFKGMEVIVDLGGNITSEWVEMAAKGGVKFIQAQTNGLDHVEVKKILESGIMLAHCPGSLSEVSLAEGAMMFILMLAHRYIEGVDNFRVGKFFFPRGMEVEGRSLGIVGFGHSGQQLARRAKSFGMRISGIDVRQIAEDELDDIQPDFMGGPDHLDKVISESDFLSVHMHLTNETKHIIDARRINLMKPTACIINVARGELIDEDALYAALLEKRIGGAGLDAFANEPTDSTLPVYKLPNVIVQPHSVAATDGTSLKRSRFAVENLDRYALGEDIVARVG